ncbi:MAG: glycoside hydrolase family 3 N-terminal domain-containing protein [Candidatus Babeliaceae bacterium]
MIFMYLLFLLCNAFMYASLPPYLDTSEWAEQTLAKLTLEEKIAQILMIKMPAQNHQSFEKYKELLRYPVGGIFLHGKNTITEQIKLTNFLQGLNNIPLLVGQDLEWGLNMRLEDGINFPRALTLGALQDFDLICQLAALIAQQCKKLGVHLPAAPVVDINTNPSNPVIGFRSFGDDKYQVAAKTLAFIKGLQENYILACAKHFPGHGDTEVDSHKNLPVVKHTQKRLDEIELYPFKQAIQAGVATIMSAHLLVNVHDNQKSATLSKKIITDLLKKQLGFKGIVITDALSMKAITKHNKPAQANIDAFLAGNDILLYPKDIPETIEELKSIITKSPELQKQLDASVFKILQAKEWLNLHRKRFVEEITAKDINTKEAFALKKQLYSAAITVVRDDNKMIPLQSAPQPNPLFIHLGQKFFNQFEEICEQNLNICANQDLYNLATKEQMDNFFNYRSTQNNSSIICLLRTTQRGVVEEHHLNFINRLHEQNNQVTTVLFGSPYTLKKLHPSIPTIVAYEDDPDAEEAAAKVLFGNQPALGQLPITLE